MYIKSIVVSLRCKQKQIDMTIKNVTIGDKFINTTDRKSKRVSTVIDFIETKSVLTGDILRYQVVCEKDYMGQKLQSVCSFSTVLMNKVK